MIRFALTCEDGHGFEGWFKSNAAFDTQAAAGQLACPICGGGEVRKAIMAPAIARTDRQATVREEAEQQSEVIPPSQAPVPVQVPPLPAMLSSPEAMSKMLLMMRAVREHVEKNFHDVGGQFPEEARKIHYGEAEHRGIFGEATSDEVKELLDEGIEIMPLPMVPKLSD